MRAGRPLRLAVVAASLLVLWACAGGVERARPTGAVSLELPEALSERPAPATPRLKGYSAFVASAFDSDRATEMLTFVDGFFRVRGNVGYQKCLSRLTERLTEGGFDGQGARVTTLELGQERMTWTPVSARLELLGDQPVTLHAFDDESAPDRATLLVGSSSIAPTDFEVVLDDSSGSTPVRGRVVLGRGSPRELFARNVVGGGAVGILTVDLESYHEAAAHPDVAQFGYLPPHEGTEAFGFSLSPRSDEALRAAIERGGGHARIRVSIEVKSGSSPATTIEAVIQGTDPEAAPIVLVAHVDEPGANDNASGVAALLELAVALRRGIESGRLPRPERRLVFLWGQEIECSREWLAMNRSRAFAGLIFDMVGADQQVVGAPLLVERMPDPGAVWMRPPDEPSGWGATSVDPRRLRGHFLTDYVLAAVGTLEPPHAGWRFRDHPFEGGSDHVPFLLVGIPALLVWHFPDAAYHTNLDRASRVSGVEMRQVAAAMGAVAMGMASGLDADRAEALAAVEHGAMVRLRYAALAAQRSLSRGVRPETEHRIIEAWIRWYDEALASVAEGSGDEALGGRVDQARAEVRSVGEELLRQLEAR